MSSASAKEHINFRPYRAVAAELTSADLQVARFSLLSAATFFAGRGVVFHGRREATVAEALSWTLNGASDHQGQAPQAGRCCAAGLIARAIHTFVGKCLLTLG